MSFVKGMFSDGHSHTLSAGSSITPQRMPTFTDNRLKTDTVLRRDSDVSLQDNEDYSRPVLRVSIFPHVHSLTSLVLIYLS
jgi:cell wall integrity and stress response component